MRREHSSEALSFLSTLAFWPCLLRIQLFLEYFSFERIDDDPFSSFPPREVLNETILQSCIVKESSYRVWSAFASDYLIYCFGAKQSQNLEECSRVLLENLEVSSGLSRNQKERINFCVDHSFTGPDSAVDDNLVLSFQKEVFNQKSIESVPVLLLNGAQYNGPMTAEYVLYSLCYELDNTPEFCFAPAPSKEKDTTFYIILGGISLIVGIFIGVSSALMCQRVYQDQVGGEPVENSRSPSYQTLPSAALANEKQSQEKKDSYEFEMSK